MENWRYLRNKLASEHFRKRKVFILHGHHRTEALKLLSEENKGTENQATNHILSYLIAENNVYMSSIAW
jgi:uncharacterized protein (DUF1015 family)